MKKAVGKFLLALLWSTVPFLGLPFLLFESGFAVAILFAVLSLLLTVLNGNWIYRTLPFVIVNLAMLACNVLGIQWTTKLYYEIVSSDLLTLAVGEAEVYGILILLSVATAIAAVGKIISHRCEKT